MAELKFYLLITKIILDLAMYKIIKNCKIRYRVLNNYKLVIEKDFMSRYYIKLLTVNI